MALDKNMDFDKVAEFYDVQLQSGTFDLAFWVDVARRSAGPRLELMCGTGRITCRILEAGLEIDGLDYSEGLLSVLRSKVPPAGPACRLHLADARSFDLQRQYRLVFIGFHSIAEVIEDSDKQAVFKCVRNHLLSEGEFWLTAHNPKTRVATLDGRLMDMGAFTLPQTGETFHVTGQFVHDPRTGIATGRQVYACSREGQPTRTVELPMRFHLVEPAQLDSLLAGAGLTIADRYGDYDRCGFDPQCSPFYIVRCSR